MTGARRAIWCSPHALGSVVRVGAHHLAARLAARGWDVLFLSNPISPLHLLNWRNPDARLRVAETFGGIRAENGMLALLPLTLLPLVGRFGGRSRWVLDRWPHFTVPNIAATLTRAGYGEADLMVLDGPIAAPLLDAVKPRRSVLRVLDRLRGFASTTPAMLAALADVARRVDLVTYSAEDLVEDVDALRPRRTLHLANGADTRPFAEARPMPSDYAAIPAPRAVYVGAMAEWFDFDLVAQAARSRPTLSFVLIGSPELARRRLPQLPNLHLLGARPWTELPGYLQHAAVGLIPFDIANHRDLVRGVNPLKLYEYAAAGLPVVSVAWPELRKLGGPIELAEGADAFMAALDRVLASPPPKAALTAFAARHDWGAGLDRLLASLDFAGESESREPAASPA